ncbi:hypothetical protein ABIF65_008270 [Bradyrhizobium japonicum]
MLCTISQSRFLIDGLHHITHTIHQGLTTLTKPELENARTKSGDLVGCEP